MKARLHAYISGRVQGVGFRFLAQHVARMLGLTGWVQNLYDGRVEVVAEGQRQQLEQFLAFQRQRVMLQRARDPGTQGNRIERLRQVVERAAAHR